MSDPGFTPPAIDFRTAPERYRHWRLTVDGHVAWLGLAVDEQGGLMPGYELKLNSYDLGVDIELYDAVQRLRFEHPEVGCVIMHSAHERVFCAGANIRMLGRASHAHKVNFCKFTNETRNSIEDASAHSGQIYICAVRGSCAGGGYELALACEEIILADDGASSVSLPEVPLLAVLPGTGGLTRLVDKRHVRRDRADFFCTTEEGVRGQRALDWKLVDALVPASAFLADVGTRAQALAARSDRPGASTGVHLAPLARELREDGLRYSQLDVTLDRALGLATFDVHAPRTAPDSLASALAQGAAFWPLALARELDDALLHLRFNEEYVGTWVFRSSGDATAVLAIDDLLDANSDHWFIREVLLYWTRVLKRIEVSARSLFALIEPGSCFAGSLLELVLAADQSFMLDGSRDDAALPPATVALHAHNFGRYPMVTGSGRVAARFSADPAAVAQLERAIGRALDARESARLGLVTFTPDDIDWEHEVRIALEARAGFSPDALSGMEANLRFTGGETLESKIFARLSAWQNWIFQRPNAVGPSGALPLYGSGKRARFERGRV